jgi:hypothetical protein
MPLISYTKPARVALITTADVSKAVSGCSDGDMATRAGLRCPDRKANSKHTAADCECLHAVVAHITAVPPLVEASHGHEAQLNSVDLHEHLLNAH